MLEWRRVFSSQAQRPAAHLIDTALVLSRRLCRPQIVNVALSTAPFFLRHCQQCADIQANRA